MILNQELIRTRYQEIAESLERLEEIKKETKENFLQENDMQDIACYRLLIAIEAALNLCYHIAARKLNKVLYDYAQCFVILADSGIIPAELSEKLQKMARFHNLLVHMYWKIDYSAVFSILQTSLTDLRRLSGLAASLV